MGAFCILQNFFQRNFCFRPAFEKVVDSLSIKDQVDIYITGSNAYMLSSELATLLSGRYTEIKMLPFSFREYIAQTGLPKEEAFAEFMKTGGIPYVAAGSEAHEQTSQTETERENKGEQTVIYNHFQPAPVPRARGDDIFTAIFDADTNRKERSANCRSTRENSKS